MKKLEDIITNNRERTISQSFYEHGVNVGRNDILPGHYYTFEIPVTNFNSSLIPNSEEEWKEDPELYITSRNYFDMIPAGLVFAHEKWKETALILNLKVVPPKYRAAIVMAHINLIEDNLDRLGVFDEDMEMASIEDRKRMNLPLFRVTPKMIEQITGIKLGYAINGYKLDKVIRAKLLDWDHIGELPLANIDTKGLAMSTGALDLSSIFNKFENKQLT